MTTRRYTGIIKEVERLSHLRRRLRKQKKGAERKYERWKLKNTVRKKTEMSKMISEDS